MQIESSLEGLICINHNHFIAAGGYNDFGSSYGQQSSGYGPMKSGGGGGGGSGGSSGGYSSGRNQPYSGG